MRHKAEGDPGFPRQGVPAPREAGAPTVIWQIYFVKNCMKMKEFGPRRGGIRDCYWKDCKKNETN